MKEGENSGAPVAPGIDTTQPQIFSGTQNPAPQSDQPVETITASSADYANAFSVTSETSSDKNVTVGAASAIKAGQGQGSTILAGDARYGAEEAPKVTTDNAPAFFTEKMSKSKTKVAKSKDIILDNEQKKSHKLLFAALSIAVIICGAIFVSLTLKNSQGGKNSIAIEDFRYSNYPAAHSLMTALYNDAKAYEDDAIALDSDTMADLFSEGLPEYEKLITDFNNIDLRNFDASYTEERKTIVLALKADYKNLQTIQSELEELRAALENSESAKLLEASKDDTYYYELYTEYKNRNQKQDAIVAELQNIDCNDPNNHETCNNLSKEYQQANIDLNIRYANATYIKNRMGNSDFPSDNNPIDKLLKLHREILRYEKS